MFKYKDLLTQTIWQDLKLQTISKVSLASDNWGSIIIKPLISTQKKLLIIILNLQKITFTVGNNYL